MRVLIVLFAVLALFALAATASNVDVESSSEHEWIIPETPKDTDVASPAPPSAHACEARGGLCLSTKLYSCNAGFLQGLCPGVASNKCCVGPTSLIGGTISLQGYQIVNPDDDVPQVLPRKSPATPAPARRVVRSAAPTACSTRGGACLNNALYTCSTGFKSGLCPGAAGIQCCIGESFLTGGTASLQGIQIVNPDAPAAPATRSSLNACEGRGGSCLNSNQYSCTSPFKGGLCPGAANIQCCIGAATPVAAPAPRSAGVTFSTLAQCYPQGEAEEVKARIGGAVNADWITNTCAIRMSHTLNCAGKSVPPVPEQFVRGGNGKNYIFRVKQLFPVVNQFFGKGIVLKAGPSGRGVDPSPLFGKKGIIRFDTTGAWSDASGHFDLWNGRTMHESHHADDATTQKYFGLALSVNFWELP